MLHSLSHAGGHAQAAKNSMAKNYRSSHTKFFITRLWATLIPAQGPAGLVFDDAGFKEILLLFQVQHFAHPGEGVGSAGKQLSETNLLTTAVGDEVQVFDEHAGIEAQHATGQGVNREASTA